PPGAERRGIGRHRHHVFPPADGPEARGVVPCHWRLVAQPRILRERVAGVEGVLDQRVGEWLVSGHRGYARVNAGLLESAGTVSRPCATSSTLGPTRAAIGAS